MLCGSVARNLKHTHKSTRDDAALRAWTTFFCGTRGVNHLWDLLAVAEAPDTAVVSDAYRHSALLHRSHLAKFRASRAHELELVKASRFGSGGGGIGGPSRDASLQQAAQLYLSVGNLQKYCEVLTELGSWNEALSLAPGVSYQYWRQLTKRRADALVQQDHIEAVGLHLALGDISAITEFLCNRGQAQDAYVMALAADDRLRQHLQPDPGPREPQTTKEDEHDSVRSLDGLVRDCAQNLSDKYLEEGAPVLAACCHLANDDIESAVRTLVQGNELELALSVALRGGGPAVNAQHVATWLAWRCCAVGNWELAMDVLALCDDAHSARVEILAGCGCSLAERNALHEKAGLPPVEECISLATMHEENGDAHKALQYYLLSEQPSRALALGMDIVRERTSQEGWTLESVWEPLRWTQAIQPRVLLQEGHQLLHKELQFFSAYIGALKAVQDGYWPVVAPLLRHARGLLKQDGAVEAVLHREELLEDIGSLVHSDVNNTKNGPVLSERLSMRLGGQVTRRGVFGQVWVAGCNLPRHSDQRRSFFTGQAIQGPVYDLEDGETTLSLSEAIMWARVNLLAPGGCRNRIVPF
ncbi:WD repeat-containing protein 17 [Ixodes scapularis]